MEDMVKWTFGLGIAIWLLYFLYMLFSNRELLNPLAPLSKKIEMYRDYSIKERWRDVGMWFVFHLLAVPFIILFVSLIVVATVGSIFGSGPSYYDEDIHVPQRYR